MNYKLKAAPTAISQELNNQNPPNAKQFLAGVDEQKRKRRKNNSIDARTLTSDLSNYLNGNEQALQLVRIPTEAQEQARVQSRQHDALVAERKRIGAMGNSLLLSRTGNRQRLGSITKVGLPAIRRIITEMVWRMSLFQPNYKAVQKWREVLQGSNRGLKKKAVVAIGRQLMVDIWRLQTGRISAQELGLIMIEA